MEQLILIKLGGSVITDKGRPFYARQRVIRRLGKEIKQAQREYDGRLIIAHGSGSFGHVLASKYKTHKGLVGKNSLKGLAETADVAAQINRIVVYNLLKVGLKVVSFAPASFIVAKSQRLYRAHLTPIKYSLKIGAIPLVYGDVIMDKDSGFCIFSAEKVLNTLIRGFAKDYRISKVIHCGRTNGVYNEDGKTIEKITQANFRKIKKQIGESEDVDVTGGMLHKVKESLKIASKFGLEAAVINGTVSGQLAKAIAGEKFNGTIIKSK